MHRAVILKQRGEFAEAERQASIVRDELRHSHLGNAASACVEIGDIRRRLGDLEGAAAAFVKRGGDLWRAVRRGRAPAARGGPRRSRRWRDRHVHGDDAHRLTRPVAVLPAVTQVAIADGNLVMATAAVAEMEELGARFATPFVEATVASALGRLQLALGEPADAEVTLQRALSPATARGALRGGDHVDAPR